jgi:DNA-binding MarR family transcriptional regulator
MTVQRRPRAKSEPASKQKLRLWIRLLRASRAIEAELRQRLRAEFGTTLPKFDVMSALDRKGTGMTMTELSRFLMVSNGNVTGIIDRLVAEGLVVRLAHEGDRRATFVCLTPKGAQTFQAMARAHEGWVNELLGAFGGADTETLIALLGHPTFKAVARRTPPGDAVARGPKSRLARAASAAHRSS